MTLQKTFNFSTYKHFFLQIFSAVDATVLSHKLLEGDLLLNVGVVQSRVEHDDGEGEDVAGVGLVEQVGVLFAVVRGKSLHDAVDLHRFTW